MTTESAAKPAFLGLLNAISVGESNGGRYLLAWAEATPDADLRRSLAFVAGRETSHGVVFRQRIERLGFELREKADPSFAERLARASDATIPDAEKIGSGRDEVSEAKIEQVLAGFESRITDEMDALTAATMRWYIEEERDSAIILRDAWDRVLARA